MSNTSAFAKATAGQSIYLVRHTESEKTVLRLNGGAGLPLTLAGIKDANVLGAHLARVVSKPLTLWAAPMVHTRQTADIIAAELSCKVNIESGLRNVNLGILDGLSDEECQKLDASAFEMLCKWRRNIISVGQLKIPNMEDRFALSERIKASLDRILKHSENHIIVCSRSSSNALNSILISGGDGRGKDYFRVRYDPGSVSHYKREEDGAFKPEYLNDTTFYNRENTFRDD